MGDHARETMNFASALVHGPEAMEEEPVQRIDVVEIDGLAVLKIVKHCKEYLPQLVTGQLLGLDYDGTLEVTNCFPFPSRDGDGQEDEEEDGEGAEYQFEMMRCLREVNVDNNTVGWYQSAYLGSHIEENLIATQYNYQESIPKCVCLIFDPLKTAQGNLALKALRLTDHFLTLYKGHEFTLDKILKAGVCAEDIFEEVPIQVRNSNLIKAFLLQMDETQIKRSVKEDDTGGITTNPFLEKNLECLITSIDDLSQESARFQYHQRALGRHNVQQSGYLAKRKQENESRRRQGLPPLEEDANVFKPLAEPSRLDSLLISKQISNYCQQINQFTGQSFNKHFLVNALRQERP